ncbi:four helix bundle protein [Pinibacter aurantiacus]|uniref:Uncharacterized protein n=1 Tax=Pinibacter aurantiacus TaxID=2851599 RepID=A0A9E2W9H7_9BACT|nr:hypothetical protein [Pinibacter aurantiacus]MBV4360076.1 hypothetical protein [Pinibacter aurantiacus]
MKNLPYDEKQMIKIRELKPIRTTREFDAVERLKSNISNSVAYKKAYELFLKISALIERMERTMERAMVTSLSNACVEMLITLYKMDMSADKTRHMAAACEKIEVVEMLLRLVKEFKMIAVFYISDLEDHIRQLSRQMYDDFDGESA